MGNNQTVTNGGMVRLSSGSDFDPHRPRSSGPLDHEEFTYCVEQGIPLAYDPLQVGWVTAMSTDDLALDSAPVDKSLQATANRLINDHIVPRSERRRRLEQCETYARRYTLREWTPADARRFVELLDNPKIWEHLPEDYPDPLTEDMAIDLIALSNDAAHHEVRAVERSGEVVGQVRLLFESRIDAGSTNNEAEISYWLGEPFWGKGIMSEVVPLYTLECFRRHPVASIFARIKAANRASIALIEKAGFRHEGKVVEELENEPGMRTYRCFRADYLGA